MSIVKTILFTVALALSACAVPAADAARPSGAVEKAHAATVRIDMNNGVCSGTVIGKRTILTATHCFKGATTFEVDGKPIQIADRVDDGNDHSIIWTDRVFSYRAKLADKPLAQRDEVYMWGNPNGMHDIYRKGTVAGFEQDERPGSVPLTLIDMNIFQGDSGAGLFDSKGDIAGVASGVLNNVMQGTYAKYAVALPFAFKATDVERATR